MFHSMLQILIKFPTEILELITEVEDIRNGSGICMFILIFLNKRISSSNWKIYVYCCSMSENKKVLTILP